MPLSIKQYAKQIRDQIQGYEDWSDADLSRWYLDIQPQDKQHIEPQQLEGLYGVRAEHRGGDFQYARYQFKEMFSGIPSALVGSIGAAIGSEEMVDYSESLRDEAKERTMEWTSDPEIAGYQAWMEDEPIRWDNFYQGEMLQRGLALAAPSIAAMVASEVALAYATSGLSALTLPGRGVAAGYRAVRAAKKGKDLVKMVDTAKDAGATIEQVTKAAQLSKNLTTMGTMGFMGVLEGTDQYNSTMDYLLEKGLDPLQAAKVAGASAAIYGTLAGIEEYIPYGRFRKMLGVGSKETATEITKKIAKDLKKAGFWKSGAKITKEGLTQAMAEAGQEYTQYMTQQAVNHFVKKGYGDVPASFWEHLRDEALTDEAISSAHSGGVMGLFMGGAGMGFRVASAKRSDKIVDDATTDTDASTTPSVSAPEEKGLSQNRKRIIALETFAGRDTSATEEEKAYAKQIKAGLDKGKTKKDVLDAIVSDINDDPSFLEEAFSDPVERGEVLFGLAVEMEDPDPIAFTNKIEAQLTNIEKNVNQAEIQDPIAPQDPVVPDDPVIPTEDPTDIEDPLDRARREEIERYTPKRVRKELRKLGIKSIDNGGTQDVAALVASDYSPKTETAAPQQQDEQAPDTDKAIDESNVVRTLSYENTEFKLHNDDSVSASINGKPVKLNKAIAPAIVKILKNDKADGMWLKGVATNLQGKEKQKKKVEPVKADPVDVSVSEPQIPTEPTEPVGADPTDVTDPMDSDNAVNIDHLKIGKQKKGKEPTEIVDDKGARPQAVQGTKHKVTKVISGMQTGADIAGNEVATELGMETGGTMPTKFMTADGSKPEYAEKYNASEVSREQVKNYSGREKRWGPRTEQNVMDADGTVIFGNEKSPGSKLTIKLAKQHGKSVIVNPTAQELSQWLIENDIETLNVAGNRESKNPGINKKAKDVLRAALTENFEPAREEDIPGTEEIQVNDIVNYKGKEYRVRRINKAGFAQLQDLETGKNYPGTPRPNKLLFLRKGTPLTGLQAKREADKGGNRLSASDGVDVMRGTKYGNPFVVPSVYDKNPSYYKKQGFIRAESRDDAIESYEAWLRGDKFTDYKQDSRQAILKDIESGKLDGATLKYFKPDAKDSHAVRLLKLIDESQARRSRTKTQDKQVPEPQQVAVTAALKGRIASSIYDLFPGMTDDKLKTIYDNYVALMNKAREGKAVPYEMFKNLVSTGQMAVFNYKDTYIFGVYDVNNAVFVIKMSSAPDSKQLLAEAIPFLVKNGLDFISFSPEDVAKKYQRSGFFSSVKGFAYNFKGEDMIKLISVSRVRVAEKIFGKGLDEVSPEELEQYNDSVRLGNVPVFIKAEDIAQHSATAAKMLTQYLSNFGITIKTFNNIKDELGIDEIAFADLLNKIAYIKDPADLPPIAGEFIAYMMQHNKLIKDIIVDMSGATKKRDYIELDKTPYFKAIGELIAQDLENKIAGQYKKSLLEKIRRVIEIFFDKLKDVPIGKINKNIGIITNNIMQQNSRLITATPFKPGASGQPISLLTLEDALEKDSFGAKIIDALSEIGFILTGSTALAEQGTVYRPDENPLHDIDWVSPFSKEETKALILSIYPDAQIVREIIGKENNTDAYIVAPDGYRVEDLKTVDVTDGDTGDVRTVLVSYSVVNEKSGRVDGTFQRLDDGTESVVGVEAKVLDFFIYPDGSSERKAPIEYTTKDGKVIRLSHWSDVFAAKLRYARMKDIWDYNRFIFEQADEQKKSSATDNIEDHRIKKLNYTEDQKKGLAMVSKMLNDAIGHFAVLAGYAGTGKTTLIENIVSYAYELGLHTNVVAITNKAVLRAQDRLKEGVGEDNPIRAGFSTIHKKLYSFNMVTRQWEFKDSVLHDNSLVIVDEASMVPMTILDEITENAYASGAKIIFLGDSFQMPPVLGPDPLLLNENGYSFTKYTGGKPLNTYYYQMEEVVRQAKMSFVKIWATALRFRKKLVFPSRSINAEGGPVEVDTADAFHNKFYRDVKRGFDSIMIVFTNKKRNNYNKAARSRKYGFEESKANPLLPDERLISVANGVDYVNSETWAFDDTIESIEPISVEVGTYDPNTRKMIPTKLKGHLVYASGKAPMLLLESTGKKASVYHGDIMNAKDFPEDFVEETKRGPKLAKHITIATYGYAITAHKAQGSEWSTIYVAEHKDFESKDDVEFAMARWLYTAVTRSSSKVVLLRQGKNEVSPEDIQIVYDRHQENVAKKHEENLQEISEISKQDNKIANNKEMADAIARRLKKAFPFITAEAVEHVYDRYGREVAGKAIDSMVQWSTSQGTLDTIPHEYAHIYTRLLKDDPWVKKAIKKFHGEEQLVEYIGMYYMNRFKNKTIHNAIHAWLKQFWLNIKKHFSKLSKKELGFLVSEKFYNATMSKATIEKTGKESLQNIVYGSQQWIKTINSLNAAYQAYEDMLRKDQAIARGKPTKDQVIGIVANLYKSIITHKDIPYIIEPVLREWALSKGYDPDSLASPMHVEPLYTQRDYEGFYEDIADGIVNDDIKSVDLTRLNRINSSVINGWGVISNIKMQEAIALMSELDMDDWVWQFIALNSNVNPELFLGGDASKANKRKVNDLRLFYNSVQSSYPSNRENLADNDKTHLYLDIVKDTDGVITKMTIERKGPVHKHTMRTNPKNIRKLLIEQINGSLGDTVAWISGKDIWETKARPNYGYYRPTQAYDPLYLDDLNKLQKELRKKKLVFVFNRGDSPLYAVAKVTERHMELAEDPEAYWNEEPDITPGQIENFLGKNATGNVDKVFHAEEIARHEAMNALLPGYLTLPARTVIKRIKIPTTPTISVGNMPDITGKVYDPSDAKFVFSDGKVVDAIQDIPGVKKKFILDGTSLTSTSLFKLFARYLGTHVTSKSKTVIAIANEFSGNLFVKHQHFKPLHEFEIRTGYVDENNAGELVARVQRNGDIVDANGSIIHVLMTEDEAKVVSGEFEEHFKAGEIFDIPGESVGHITAQASGHNKAKFPLQLLNYIHDPDVLDAFREEMFPGIINRVRQAFTLAKSSSIKNGAKRLTEFMSILSKSDNGISSAVSELFNLGLGLHPAGGKLLNKIVNSRLIAHNLNLNDMPGITGDIIANVRNDLAIDEVNVAMSDAGVIRADFIKANPHMTPNRININNWLANHPYYMLIYRSPIPSLTGAKMVRVKSLHNSSGVVELNPVLIFRDLEGDGDGDHVGLLQLPPKLQQSLINLYNRTEATGINLEDYVTEGVSYELSRRRDLFQLTANMTHGGKAIAEIANIQTLYSILLETVNHVIVNDTQIPIRGLNDIITMPSGVKGNIDRILQIYLQAAVDNTEFMLLAEWGYSRESLIYHLFDVPDHIKRDDFLTAIQPLLQTLKSFSGIIQGEDWTMGKYGVDYTIRQSNQVHEFLSDKATYIESLIGVDDAKKYGLEVSFNGKMHILEELASIPATLYDEFIGDDRGLLSVFRDSPYVFQENISLVAHQETFKEMQVKKAKEFSNIYYDEIQNGEAYANQMGMEMYKLIGKLTSTDLTNDVFLDTTLGWDTNEEMIKFANEWSLKYNQLTEMEKKAATYTFFDGVLRFPLNKKGEVIKGSKLQPVKNPKYLPPISNQPLKLTLLHPDVASEYFKLYNDNLYTEVVRTMAKRTDLHKQAGRKLTLRNASLVSKTIKKEC